MPSSSTQTVLTSTKRSAALGETLVRARRLAPWIAITFTMLLAITTLMIGWMVRQSMRELTQKSVESALAANLAGLDRWVGRRLDDCGRLATRPELAQQAKELLGKYGGQSQLNFSELVADKSFPQLLQRLAPDTADGWVLFDDRGRVVSASQGGWVGQTLPIPSDVQEQIDAGESVMCRPLALTTADEVSGDGQACLLFVTPLTEGVQTLGSFALLVDAADEFTESLNIARIGSTGETYALDRRGVLLSRSRFERRLRQTGLLDANKEIASPLNVSIRDPGVDLTVDRASQTRANQPLTLMADQATRGATGSNVTGYNNYLGESVIGAWQWLPQYNMGIATEMNYTEAYGALRIIRNAFAGALAMVVLSGIGVFSLLRLIRRVEGRPSNKELSRRLGQYDLGGVIGCGGMGSVYHGQHHLLKRDVAIKVLEHTHATVRSLSRFEREVQMTAKLRHPNTIEIYDYGRTPEGTFFYVMEYVDGISLQQLVDYYGRQPAERVIYLLLQVCGSLSEAHHKSVVHRDIKPANILLAAQAGLYDLVKVLDFGLVKEIDRETVELTRTESMTGTPLYMSPETVRDASKADGRSDLYSVGAVGYTLLTGMPTFDGPSAADICAKQLHEEPIRPATRIGADLPEDLQNVLMSCLRKDPADRPSSVDELADALLQCHDAGQWTVADACLWWESVFDGPRDDLGQFDDNSRPGGMDPSPNKKRREPKPGHDTKVDQPPPGSFDLPTQNTAR